MIVGAAFFLYPSSPSGPPTSISSTSAVGLPGPTNSSQLIESNNEPPASCDPAAAAFVGEDEIVTNVYQPLLTFNYTSLTVYAPILAASWTTSPDGLSYSFTLRQNAYFMNGDPFDASVVWFNFNRLIMMNQFGASMYVNLLYNASLASTSGYALSQGVIDAMAANGYTFSTTNATVRQAEAASALSQILSRFNASNSTIKGIMSYPHQAVVVLGQYNVQFNLMNRYVGFLEILSEPSSADGMVAPSFVDQHGGVQPNSVNSYVNTHSMGTGPYTIENYVQGAVLTMVANPNYWAAKLPASDTNIMLTPPRIPVVIVEYSTEATQAIQGIESNQVQLIEGWPIPSLPPIYFPTLSAYPGVQVKSLANAPIVVGLMIPLDTEKYPLSIPDFRVAIEHAINYSEIVSTVGQGYWVPYLGPITTGLPNYNPSNLPTYDFNPELSISLLKNLGFTLNLANGTVINPGGKSAALSLMYSTEAPEEVKIAQEVQIMLGNIGVQLSLNPVTAPGMIAALSQPGTAASYPEMIIWYWNTYWPEPIEQEVVVQISPLYGGIAGDLSWFNNSTVNTLVANLASQTDPVLVRDAIAKVYDILYQQAPDVWLAAVVPYWIQRSYVAGVIYNAGLLGYYFPLIYYNTSSTVMPANLSAQPVAVPNAMLPDSERTKRSLPIRIPIPS